MRHCHIVEVATLLDGRYCVCFVYIGMAEVYQYYLLRACAQILLAELGAIVKTKMPLWMAHAHIVVAEVVQEGIVVVVAFDHNAVDVSETEVDSCCVGNKKYSFICRRFYKETVIWCIMRRFKGLDDKSSNFVRKVAEKRRKAFQIGFFDYLFVCKARDASSDELFCGGWVDVVAVPIVLSPMGGNTASHLRQFSFF